MHRIYPLFWDFEKMFSNNSFRKIKLAGTHRFLERWHIWNKKDCALSLSS